LVKIRIKLKYIFCVDKFFVCKQGILVVPFVEGFIVVTVEVSRFGIGVENPNGLALENEL
jgi:hypothetical protein